MSNSKTVSEKYWNIEGTMVKVYNQSKIHVRTLTDSQFKNYSKNDK